MEYYEDQTNINGRFQKHRYAFGKKEQKSFPSMSVECHKDDHRILRQAIRYKVEVPESKDKAISYTELLNNVKTKAETGAKDRQTDVKITAIAPFCVTASSEHAKCRVVWCECDCHQNNDS